MGNWIKDKMPYFPVDLGFVHIGKYDQNPLNKVESLAPVR
jgi:hypothetical protein